MINSLSDFGRNVTLASSHSNTLSQSADCCAGGFFFSRVAFTDSLSRVSTYIVIMVLTETLLQLGFFCLFVFFSSFCICNTKLLFVSLSMTIVKRTQKKLFVLVVYFFYSALSVFAVITFQLVVAPAIHDYQAL